MVLLITTLGTSPHTLGNHGLWWGGKGEGRITCRAQTKCNKEQTPWAQGGGARQNYLGTMHELSFHVRPKIRNTGHTPKHIHIKGVLTYRSHAGKNNGLQPVAILPEGVSGWVADCQHQDFGGVEMEGLKYQ